MGTIQQLAFFLLALGPLIFIHELGHFLVAKALNVKVLRFSIGFGPRLLGFQRGETEYWVSWIPLGGYVKMAGDNPHEELAPHEAKRGFLAQSPWRRALIVVAGPLFNVIFPILLLFVALQFETKIESNRVGSLEPGLPAALAGVRPGDRIRSINGHATETFGDIVEAMQSQQGQDVAVELEREGKLLSLHITPVSLEESDPIERVTRSLLGISPSHRPPLLGVVDGSPAHRAGLRTFDRVVSINGQPVVDEAELGRRLVAAEGALEIVAARFEWIRLPGARVRTARVVRASLERQPGELYAALGAEPADTFVAYVRPGGGFDKAGIKVGDRVLEIGGREVASRLVLYRLLESQTAPAAPARGLGCGGQTAADSKEPTVELTWHDTGGNVHKRTVGRARVRVFDPAVGETDHLSLGVGFWITPAEPDTRELLTRKLGPGQAMAVALKAVPDVTRKTALTLYKLFTFQLSMRTLGGPFMMADLATRSAERGVEEFLQTMAVLSVNLGLLNLLPIPILDGFGLLSAFWEGIRRRPIPTRAREIAQLVGLVILAMLMIVALTNDLRRT